MCSFDFDGDRADAWVEHTRKARREHRCELCGWTILKGNRYIEIRSLYDHHWSTGRFHKKCKALSTYIQLDMCGQYTYFLVNLRDMVREHYPGNPELLRKYRDCLREHYRPIPE